MKILRLLLLRPKPLHKSIRVPLQRSKCGCEIIWIAIIEIRVPTCRAYRPKRIRMPHPHHQCPITARRFPHHGPSLTFRNGSKRRIHLRHDLLDQIILISPGRRRIYVLRAAVVCKTIRHHRYHRPDLARGEKPIHPFGKVRPERVIVQQHLPAPGESREAINHRITFGRTLITGRKIDEKISHMRVTERIPAKHLALKSMVNNGSLRLHRLGHNIHLVGSAIG